MHNKGKLIAVKGRGPLPRTNGAVTEHAQGLLTSLGAELILHVRKRQGLDAHPGCPCVAGNFVPD